MQVIIREAGNDTVPREVEGVDEDEDSAKHLVSRVIRGCHVLPSPDVSAERPIGPWLLSVLKLRIQGSRSVPRLSWPQSVRDINLWYGAAGVLCYYSAVRSMIPDYERGP